VSVALSHPSRAAARRTQSSPPPASPNQLQLRAAVKLAGEEFAEQIADAQAPFWAHVCDALATGRPSPSLPAGPPQRGPFHFRPGGNNVATLTVTGGDVGTEFTQSRTCAGARFTSPATAVAP
jgi:hypothetical protein